MIDLNLKPKQEHEGDEPAGTIILALMPFVLVFYILLIRGL